MAKKDTSAYLWRLLFITSAKGQDMTETEIKGGLTYDAAEALQAKTIKENRAEFEKLTAELAEIEEAPDSAEKRGKIKKLTKALASLQYPQRHASFAIERDRVAEAKAADNTKKKGKD